MTDESSTVILGVRHGEVHNPRHVIYAGLDGYGLSDTGRQQAQDVAEAMKRADISAIYASPLQRAVETADAISEATGVEVLTDDRLYEWRHWTQWAGLTWEQLRTDHRDAWDRYTTDPGGVTDGESLAQLTERVHGFLEEVTSRHAGGRVVAVAHLEPLRAALLHAQQRPAADLFAIRIGPGQCVRLRPDAHDEPGDPSRLVAL